MKKSFLSLITALVMVLSLLPSGIAFGEERTYIPEIVATSNIESLLGFGNPISMSTNPTITITTGAPAHYNPAGIVNWYKKDSNGAFKACRSGEAFTMGTYRLICDFGLYAGNNSSYYLDENTTLTVDGVAWTFASYHPMNGYEYMVFRSPEFTVHDFTEWHSDSANHWHQCPDCGAIQDTAAHTPDHEGSATAEYPILCSVCGYEIEPMVGHTHAFTQEVVADKYKITTATCHSKAVYYKSCTCGAKGTETFEGGDTLPHNVGTEWLSDENYHWHTCKNQDCGAAVESTKAAHTYDSDADYRCNICKAKREDNRTRIDHIEATSDIASILALGNTMHKPTITVTTGSPANHNSNGTDNFYKIVDGVLKAVKPGDTFTCGTYKMICHFGLYNYDNDSLALSESTTVTVDGADWTVSSYRYMDYYEYIVVNSPEIELHTPVTDPAVPVTCTAAGKTEGSHCSTCGEVLVAQETIPATGHKVVVDKPVAATYTKTGLTAGTHCSVCGKILEAQKVVPKLAKKANPLTANGKTKTVIYSAVKKKNQTVKRADAITLSKAKGTVNYTKSSGNQKITVDKKTGKITVKKGLKKGTYKVKVKVKAAGDSTYKSKTVTVTVTIKVK